MLPAIRQNAGSFSMRLPAGGVNAPAATDSAVLIEVFDRLILPSAAQSAAWPEKGARGTITITSRNMQISFGIGPLRRIGIIERNSHVHRGQLDNARVQAPARPTNEAVRSMLGHRYNCCNRRFARCCAPAAELSDISGIDFCCVDRFGPTASGARHFGILGRDRECRTSTRAEIQQFNFHREYWHLRKAAFGTPAPRRLRVR